MTTIDARKLQDVAAVIKAVRTDAGISQADLADRLAFSRDYLIDIESGAGTVYTSRLFRIFHELGITITLTYGGDSAQS